MDAVVDTVVDAVEGSIDHPLYIRSPSPSYVSGIGSVKHSS